MKEMKDKEVPDQKIYDHLARCYGKQNNNNFHAIEEILFLNNI
jgi:hypothetical protein